MAVDGSIRVETKLDTKGFDKGVEDVIKICDNAKKHIESIAESLNIKTNPIEIISNSQLAKAKKRLEEINAEIAEIQALTDDMLPMAETDEQTLNLLKLEEEQTKDLVAEQNNLNKAISEYEAKREKKAAEKQQNTDVKSINSDVSGTVAGDDFVSKIKNAEQYEATLEKVKAKMQTIEQETEKLAAQKGIDGSDALKANKEYQKLKKQYDALIANADKFKRSSKDGFKSAADGAKSLGSSMKSAMKTMAKYTLAIFSARSVFYAVKNAIRQVLSDNEELNNTVTAMKGAFANALAPVIERVVYWLKYAFAYLNLFVKVLTGVDMAAQYNAKAINKQTEATKKNAAATKEANKQLASFDEKNVQSANNQSSADDSVSGSTAALLDLPDVGGGKFEQICETIKANLEELMILAGWAMIGIGLILLALGQYPIGIACLIAGIVLEAKALGNWNQLSEEAQNMISAIMGIAGVAFLALGIILCVAQQYPLGIALIVLGVAMIATAIALNWDGIKAKIDVMLDKIKQAVMKSFLIVLGIILCATGVGLPLGIALIVEGIKAVRSEETLDWEAIKTHIETALTKVKNIITGVLMMVVGVLLCCTGVGIPLGVGLIIEGVRAIKSDEALDWEKMKNEIQTTMDKVKMYLLNAGAIVVGILLCATGVSLPLGLALVLSGIKAFKTGETINSDLILNTVKDVWAKIKSFWNAHIGYVFKSEWWTNKFSCIKQGMKNALNGVITIVENTINRVVGELNSFSIKIPDWVPDYGGSSLGFNIPYAHLPRLAKGGIVNNPGRGQAVIAGEAGAEAILPLQNNTEWMDMLVDKVADRVSMNVINRITIDGKDVNSSNRKYDSRFAFATNGGVL